MTIDSSINICFYGLNRSLSSTIDSINKYIFDSLSSLGVSYHIYGVFSQVKDFSNDRSGESRLEIQNNESELIKFSELKYIDQNTFDDSIAWDQVFEFGDFYSQILGKSDFDNKNSTAKNIFRSLWCLKSTYALVPEGRKNLPTIFVRPDLEILSDINWSFYLELLEKKPRKYAFGDTDGVALVPGWHSWDGLNDRFALCSPGNASNAYANRFDGLIPYIKMSRHPLHPESYLLHILQASRVEVLPIISTCMSRIRANGNSQSEDFAQGSKSYSLQTETLSCLQKLLQERTHESASLRKEHLKWTEEKSSFLIQLQALKDEYGALEKKFADASSDAENKLADALRDAEKKSADALRDAETKFEDVCAEKIDLLRQLKELSENLSVIESSYLDSKETADLTMSQLVQVQQELEHYYLMSCNLMSMVDRYSKLEAKSIQIMSKLS